MRHLNSRIQLEDTVRFGQVDNTHQYHPFRDAKDYCIPKNSFYIKWTLVKMTSGYLVVSHRHHRFLLSRKHWPPMQLAPGQGQDASFIINKKTPI